MYIGRVPLRWDKVFYPPPSPLLSTVSLTQRQKLSCYPSSYTQVSLYHLSAGLVPVWVCVEEKTTLPGSVNCLGFMLLYVQDANSKIPLLPCLSNLACLKFTVPYLGGGILLPRLRGSSALTLR